MIANGLTFHQFLTGLSARHMIVAKYCRLTFLFKCICDFIDNNQNYSFYFQVSVIFTDSFLS